MYLIFDTETTGLPARGKPIDQQPYVVQLAVSLYDENRRPIFEISTLVNNPGVDYIPAEAAKVHGITAEQCKLYGQSPKAVAKLFEALIARSAVQVAHNAQFDAQLMNYLFWRLDLPRLQLPNLLCTCDASLDIVKAPPTEKMVAAGRTGYKRPSLIEAHRHFFGEGFEGAHDALVDTRACARVYFELLERGHIPAPKGT